MERLLVKGEFAGCAFEMYMPSVDELDKLKDGPSLFRKCVASPSGEELAATLARKPGLPSTMGLALLRATGLTGPLEQLEEHELSEEVAAAFVRFEDLGELYAIRFKSKAVAFEITIVARTPNSTELAKLEKKGGALACRDFIRGATVYPVGADRKLDCTEIDRCAPGFYVAAANLLSERAGTSLTVELGEA